MSGVFGSFIYNDFVFSHNSFAPPFEYFLPDRNDLHTFCLNGIKNSVYICNLFWSHNTFAVPIYKAKAIVSN